MFNPGLGARAMMGRRRTLGGAAPGIWDLTNATYSGNSFLSPNVGSPNFAYEYGFYMKPDGTQFWSVGQGFAGRIFEYDVSTPFDMSTAAYNDVTVDIDTYDSAPEAIFFKPDGTAVWWVGKTNINIYYATLSPAWDLSGFSYQSSTSISPETVPTSLWFHPSGTYFFTTGASKIVTRWSMSPAWDISTASHDGAADYDYSAYDSAGANSISFKSDGTKMFIQASTPDYVFQFTLSTPWDPSTATHDGGSPGILLDVTSQDGNPTASVFEVGGNYFYMYGISTNTFYQYTVS